METEGSSSTENPSAEDVFLAYHMAILSGDLDALRNLMIPELVQQMDTPKFQAMLTLVMASIPPEVEIVECNIEGDGASLTARGAQAGGHLEGSVFLHCLDGKWLIAGESWKRAG